MQNQRDESNVLISCGIVLGIVVAWGASIFIVKSLVPQVLGILVDDPKFHEGIGVFGDSFGGVTSLFTGLALAFLIMSVVIQRKELRLTQRELANQVALSLRQAQLTALASGVEVWKRLSVEKKGKPEEHYRRGRSEGFGNLLAHLIADTIHQSPSADDWESIVQGWRPTDSVTAKQIDDRTSAVMNSDSMEAMARCVAVSCGHAHAWLKPESREFQIVSDIKEIAYRVLRKEGNATEAKDALNKIRSLFGCSTSSIAQSPNNPNSE